MPYAILFPGQGSQFVGMGADVFTARPDLAAGFDVLGATADEILGFDLRALCETGPEEELTRTDRAQPALYAVSLALWAALRGAVEAAGVDGPAAAAGHSLGEYTALAAAGSFDPLTGLALVAERGRAMADAATKEPGSMAALLGVDEDAAERIAADRRAAGGRLWVANLNAPGQIVMSGGVEDIEWLVANARDLGARRAIPLKVAGAFHSPLMAPAAERLATALQAADVTTPAFPVYANATAAPVTDVRAALVTQLTAPVRFAASLRAMADAGVDTFVHVGPGDVTAGLARRSVPDANVVTVSSLDQVDAAVGALSVA